MPSQSGGTVPGSGSGSARAPAETRASGWGRRHRRARRAVGARFGDRVGRVRARGQQQQRDAGAAAHVSRGPACRRRRRSRRASSRRPCASGGRSGRAASAPSALRPCRARWSTTSRHARARAQPVVEATAVQEARAVVTQLPAAYAGAPAVSVAKSTTTLLRTSTGPVTPAPRQHGGPAVAAVVDEGVADDVRAPSLDHVALLAERDQARVLGLRPLRDRVADQDPEPAVGQVDLVAAVATVAAEPVVEQQRLGGPGLHQVADVRAARPAVEHLEARDVVDVDVVRVAVPEPVVGEPAADDPDRAVRVVARPAGPSRCGGTTPA